MAMTNGGRPPAGMGTGDRGGCFQVVLMSPRSPPRLRVSSSTASRAGDPFKRPSTPSFFFFFSVFAVTVASLLPPPGRLRLRRPRQPARLTAAHLLEPLAPIQLA
jgi:hypothetical protein